MPDSKQRKKILIATLSLASGGVEKSLVNFLNEIPKGKYDIDLLLFRKEGMFLDQVPDFVNILDTPKDLAHLYSPLKSSGKWFPIKIAGSVYARLREHTPREIEAFRWKKCYSKYVKKLANKYDVAIAYLSGEVFYFIEEKVEANKKVVFIHNDYRTAKHPKKYDQKSFANVDYIVTISEQCKKILLEEFPQYQDKIRYVQNITSSKVIKEKADEFIPAEFDGKVPCLLSIGRLNEQKGFDIAVKAMRALINDYGVNVKWYIIGDGELRPQLELQIKKYNLQDSFILLGLRTNPYPYIKSCYAFIQPSRYEGKSVALDEAKILSKPIIVTNYPTASDQITDGIEGLIVDLNPTSIAEGILKIINDHSLYNILESNLAKNDYGNQVEISKYFELIDDNK